jgi:hypothetical protein
MKSNNTWPMPEHGFTAPTYKKVLTDFTSEIIKYGTKS